MDQAYIDDTTLKIPFDLSSYADFGRNLNLYHQTWFKQFQQHFLYWPSHKLHDYLIMKSCLVFIMHLIYVQFNLQKSFEGFANLQPDTGQYRELGVN